MIPLTTETGEANGFEVYPTGEIIAPELTNDIIGDSATGNILATRDYVNIGSRDFINLANNTTSVSIPNNCIFIENTNLKFKDHMGNTNYIYYL